MGALGHLRSGLAPFAVARVGAVLIRTKSQQRGLITGGGRWRRKLAVSGWHSITDGGGQRSYTGYTGDIRCPPANLAAARAELEAEYVHTRTHFQQRECTLVILAE